MESTGIIVTQLAASLAKAAPELDEAEERLALEVYRQLARGRPASLKEVRKAVGMPEAGAEAKLKQWPGVFRDGEGRIVGFWGLTVVPLVPTHRFQLDGRDLYAWCAWDTLFLPGLIKETARVESTCPTTLETIALVVDPTGVRKTSHPQAVVSFLAPDRGFDADVIQSFCHFVHFLASRSAGEAWTADHPGTFLLSLQEAFELGRLVNARNFPSTLGGGR